MGLGKQCCTMPKDCSFLC